MSNRGSSSAAPFFSPTLELLPGLCSGADCSPTYHRCNHPLPQQLPHGNAGELSALPPPREAAPQKSTLIPGAPPNGAPPSLPPVGQAQSRTATQSISKRSFYLSNAFLSSLFVPKLHIYLLLPQNSPLWFQIDLDGPRPPTCFAPCCAPSSAFLQLQCLPHLTQHGSPPPHTRGHLLPPPPPWDEPGLGTHLLSCARAASASLLCHLPS